MKRFFLFVLIVLFVSTAVPETCYANAGQSPAVIIAVENPPLTLDIKLEGTYIDKKADYGVVYYAFYYYGQNDIGNELYVSFRNEQYTIPFRVGAYHDIYKLDLYERTLTPGGTGFGFILWNSLQRLLVTLLIEGVCFYKWGHREKRSWICFFSVNILTQIMLSVFMNSQSPFGNYMSVFRLLFMEIVIFSVEMIAYAAFINEKKTSTNVMHAFLANGASLFTGSLLLLLYAVIV